MPPSNLPSGEWLQLQAALTDAVARLRTELQGSIGDLRNDMGREFGDMRRQLTEIHTSLAEGRTTMEFQREALERESRERSAIEEEYRAQAREQTSVTDELENRLRDHSDKFRRLNMAAPEDPKSGGVVQLIKDKAVEAAVTAVVLGVLAVAYNVWRDQAIKDAVDARMQENNARHVVPHAPVGP